MGSGRMPPMKAKMLAADKRERKKAAGAYVYVPIAQPMVERVTPIHVNKLAPDASVSYYRQPHKVPVLEEHVSKKRETKDSLPNWGMSKRAHEVQMRKYILRKHGPDAVAARDALIPLT